MSRFIPASIQPVDIPRADALWFVFQGGRLLIAQDSALSAIPEIHDIAWFGFSPGDTHYLGRWDDKPCFAMAVAEDEQAPTGFYFEDLRKLLLVFEQDLFLLAGRAFQILEWARNHRFCSRCGSPTTAHALGERAAVCTVCGFSQYPRINPCVIVVVTRGEELLLARGHRFNRPMFSALAGFIEAGESAEMTLHREVKEEVGIAVKDLRYFGSQPWPFPGNLMLGFHAEYAGGDIVVQEDEIAEAAFFHYRQLPVIPPPGSIAHALIMDVVKRFSA